MKKVSTFALVLILLLVTILPAAASAPASVIPTFSILSVDPDVSVTIRTYNFPANDTFNLLMGQIGTRGVGGIKVDTINSGAGGSFDMTFKIPDALKGQYQIAIRLQSTISAYFDITGFIIRLTGTGGQPVYPTLPSGVYPTFSIVSVDPNVSVTVQTQNLPANDTFVVTMGPMGTKGINGTKVDTVDTGNGGSVKYTFIAGLIEHSRPADVVTVYESLQSAGKSDAAGGLAYLNALAQNTPSAANISRYGEIVRDRSVLRRLVSVGDDIATSALNPQGRETKTILDEAESKVFRIAEEGARGRQGFVEIEPLLTKVVERINELFERANPSDVTGVPTGFVDVDKMTSGLQPGDLIVVAGRPSMGKTAFALNIGEHVAMTRACRLRCSRWRWERSSKL